MLLAEFLKQFYKTYYLGIFHCIYCYVGSHVFFSNIIC